MIDTTGIKVPTSLVPRAYVDYDMEAQQILGLPFELPDGARIPPLTPAALIALELVSSPFFKDPHGCDAIDASAAIRIITVATHRPDQLSALLRDPDTLNMAAAEWLLQHGDALAKVYELVVQWILDVPFYGFAMRPGQGKRREKYFWFDGEFAGALLAPASKILATPAQDILWHTPLCLIGHAVAQHDAAMGTKGVERPPDLAALDRMMAEAAEREDRGELHPWQYVDPDNYGLTDRQVRANPDLIGVFAQILDDVHAGRHPQPPAHNDHTVSGAQAAQAPAQALDEAVAAAQGAPSTTGDRFAFDQSAATGFAVDAPSGARDALPTITITPSASEAKPTAAVQDLSCRPSGARTESAPPYGI